MPRRKGSKVRRLPHEKIEKISLLKPLGDG